MAGETAAILVAAGTSQRMGGVDKLWADLGGRPLLAWSLEMLASLDAVGVVVVVTPAGRHAEIEALASAGAAGAGRTGEAELRCVE
ncbi:MAG: NTP transferase domain-containing protein, partial [Planctomycetota bacterium]|nr:NTP transferase domain-containing protein [Planctomycetota bacterium]